MVLATLEPPAELVPPWLALLLAALSYLGSATLLGLVLAGWYAVRPDERVFSWLGLVLAATTTGSIMKRFNDLGRPGSEPTFDGEILPLMLDELYAHPITLESTGFPSGHTITAVVFWGVLAMDLDIGTRQGRGFVATSLVVVVGATRYFLGAHWLHDVVAGMMLGVGLLAVVHVARRRVDRPIELTFGLAGTVAAGGLLTTGSAGAMATFAIAWGVFLGIALQGRVSWFGRSGIRPRPDGLADVVVAAGFLTIAVATAINPSPPYQLLALTPLMAVAIHWHPRWLRRPVAG